MGDNFEAQRAVSQVLKVLAADVAPIASLIQIEALIDTEVCRPAP